MVSLLEKFALTCSFWVRFHKQTFLTLWRDLLRLLSTSLPIFSLRWWNLLLTAQSFLNLRECFLVVPFSLCRRPSLTARSVSVYVLISGQSPVKLPSLAYRALFVNRTISHDYKACTIGINYVIKNFEFFTDLTVTHG